MNFYKLQELILFMTGSEIMMTLLSIGFMLFFPILIISIIIFNILSIIFWIFMIVDVSKRKFPKEDDKILWILVVIFGGIIGALIYYFIIKSKDKKPLTKKPLTKKL